ncbi:MULTISPECIES: TRAP transporter substrate-binding protein DctP [unclassified Halomonas]|uniref:TRAP transporter substrate-binding protein n=1 Tax=unclassified Halomonas TaxID=2609666 RepID=UPI00209E227D|nr:MULTISPECIES: TRAP transporter substrate-binding protein DctP [unclassified Halomonas]MCP1313650.1 TRAP transporter substrate-binding protein DctP [Halomonas sp. 707D7]MCP1325650.1 TRAP transporter substrate-binding protein DctP [Halomonas sp. 707D4]
MKASKTQLTRSLSTRSVASRLLTTASVGALLVGLSATAQADNWRYAHEEYEDDVQDVFAQEFKNYIEENSDHTVQVYRFGELGESDDIMEQTQNGILQFVNQSPGFTGALIPEAQIFFIPYLLPTDEQTVLNFFDESRAINEMFPELYAEQGLELLKMYPEGEMVITTNEPISSPEDMRNKKIRTMTNPLLSETYSAFGATPTPLPWGEVYGGLQTGILDGQENPIFWIESGGLYEVSPHLTFTGHGWFTTAMMANQDFYDGLSEEDQQLVQDATEAAYAHTMEHIQGLAEESLEKIQEASDEVTVTRLDDEQIEAFRERAPQVEERFLEMTGERGAELLELFKEDLANVTDE